MILKSITAMQAVFQKKRTTRPLLECPIKNEDGFILVITMVVLVVLTLLGLAALRNSRVELQIAGNDRLHKVAMYEADGGTEVGSYLLEENISCPAGFSTNTIGSTEITSDLKFWANEDAPTDADGNPTDDYPSDTIRHIRYPKDDSAPHTNIYFIGDSAPAPENAIHMLSGYEGTGYSAAQGGGVVETYVNSQHLGAGNSRSTIRINWRHIIGLEGRCKY